MSLDVGWGPDGRSGGENPFDFVLPDKNEPTTSWRWATVVSTIPLRVTLDGDDAPLLATPWDMGSPAPRVPGDRVYCQINARRVVILGPSGAVAGAVTNATPNGHMAGAAGRLVKWGSNSTITVPDPTGTYDVANKRYVDQIHRATELGANINLDTIIEPGAYVQSHNAEASTSLNYPVAAGGLLEVYGLGDSTGMRWQRYSEYRQATAGQPHRAIYQRAFYQNAWSAWSLIYEPPLFISTAAALGVTTTAGATAFVPSVTVGGGVLTGQLTFTIAAARAAGSSGGLQIGTIAAEYRPASHAPMFWENGVFGYINSSGVMFLNLNIPAISAGQLVYFKTTYRYR